MGEKIYILIWKGRRGGVRWVKVISRQPQLSSKQLGTKKIYLAFGAKSLTKLTHNSEENFPISPHLYLTPLSQTLLESRFMPLLDTILTGGKYLVSQVTIN